MMLINYVRGSVLNYVGIKRGLIKIIKAICGICKEEIIENFFYRRTDDYSAIGICCYDDYKEKDKLFEVKR
jgi:hypothetical protein